MRGRAYSKKTRTQSNKVNARARAFKNNANSKNQHQCENARIQTIPNSSKHDQCAGAHSTEPRTQATKVNAPARAFNKSVSSSKECPCAGARIQKQRELKQTRSMRGRAHSKKLRTQANTINVRPRAFKQIAKSIKQCQCAGARIQRNRERKQTMSMRGRAYSKTLRIQ